MNCVACNEPMVVLELNEVEVDHCLACGGTWLDAGELELLLEDRAEAKRLLEQTATAGERHSGSRKCPICLKKMEVISVGTHQKVEIDRCLKNDGFWFDRGELEEVLTVFDPQRHSRVHKLLREIFHS